MTVTQRQCLLKYLGYYVGSVDGKWGQLSAISCKSFQKDYGLLADGICGSDTEKALKHAVAYGMPSKASSGSVSEDFWKGIKYFRKDEFVCRCGCGADKMEEKLIRAADKVRGHFNAPVNVTSGRRCTKHNANVGGVSNSRHLSGKAMDFSVTGFSASSVLDYVQKLPEIRYAYAIDSKHIHMDIN